MIRSKVYYRHERRNIRKCTKISSSQEKKESRFSKKMSLSINPLDSVLSQQTVASNGKLAEVQIPQNQTQESAREAFAEEMSACAYLASKKRAQVSRNCLGARKMKGLKTVCTQGRFGAIKGYRLWQVDLGHQTLPSSLGVHTEVVTSPVRTAHALNPTLRGRGRASRLGQHSAACYERDILCYTVKRLTETCSKKFHDAIV